MNIENSKNAVVNITRNLLSVLSKKYEQKVVAMNNTNARFTIACITAIKYSFPAILLKGISNLDEDGEIRTHTVADFLSRSTLILCLLLRIIQWLIRSLLFTVSPFLWGAPTIKLHLHSWASWIRTSVCSSQSAVPYRLAIAQDGRFIWAVCLHLRVGYHPTPISFLFLQGSDR